MKLALTGGTGFVGQAVLDEAARRGLRLRALARREQAPREGVEWIAGDLGAPAALDELLAGCDGVLHIAGVVNAVDAAGFHLGNVAGTQNVVDAARRAGVARFIHTSSLAAREPQLSDYGHSKRLAEAVVQAGGQDWTIVRPPAVYGPRDTEILQLFRAARWHFVPMPPEGRSSIIHVDDLARLLLDLPAAAPATAAQILEPDDGNVGGWSHRDLAQAIGGAVGKRVWAPHVPRAVLAGAARLDALLRGAQAKLTPDRARYIAHPDWVCDPARNVPADVWQAEIGAEQGMAQTANWYRRHGWL